MDNCLLERMVTHCFSTVPYYEKIKEQAGDSFYGLPIITKEMVSLNPHDFLSSSYVKPYELGRLINKKTSGSTGTCLTIYWSHGDDTLANLDAWKYRHKWYGVSIKDKYVSFHSTLYYANRLAEEEPLFVQRGNNLSLCKNKLTKQTIGEYFELIKSVKPSWMFLQPSVLQLLFRYASEEQLSILNGLQYIELTGEYLSEQTKKAFESLIPNVKIANMYGTTETGCVALQCPCGHMHILQNAVVEIFDEEYKHQTESEGHVVLTTLKNYAMPLLRYRIGDKGLIKRSNCECGFCGDDIIITAGREGDIVYSPDGNNKTCYSFLKVVEYVNDEFNNPIVQFNFVQPDKQSLVMYLQIKPSYDKWKRSIEQLLYDKLREEFSAFVNIKIVFDGEYDFERNNKIKFFERKYLSEGE